MWNLYSNSLKNNIYMYIETRVHINNIFKKEDETMLDSIKLPSKDAVASVQF